MGGSIAACADAVPGGEGIAEQYAQKQRRVQGGGKTGKQQCEQQQPHPAAAEAAAVFHPFDKGHGKQCREKGVEFQDKRISDAAAHKPQDEQQVQAGQDKGEGGKTGFVHGLVLLLKAT